MIKLMIIDDQKILLDGLARIFEKEKDIKIVGLFPQSDVADAACIRLDPDILLMDICIEGRMSGINTARELKEHFPRLKIIIMTGFPEISFLEKAKEAGADSFIYKDSSAEEFISCVRNTLQGHHIYPCGSRVYEHGQSDLVLTKRELQILEYICQGLSYQDIAERMMLSKRTVSFHVSNLLLKTGNKSIVGLAVDAVNKGYTGK